MTSHYLNRNHIIIILILTAVSVPILLAATTSFSISLNSPENDSYTGADPRLNFTVTGTEDCYNCTIKLCSEDDMYYEYNTSGYKESETNCSTSLCADSTHRYDGCEGGQGCLTTDCTLQCVDSSTRYSNCTDGDGCSGQGNDCTLDCYDSTHTYSGCTNDTGCSGQGNDCTLDCYNGSHTYAGCTNDTGCSDPGTDCTQQCYDSRYKATCSNNDGCDEAGYDCHNENGCVGDNLTSYKCSGGDCVENTTTDCTKQCVDSTHAYSSCSSGSCSGSVACSSTLGCIEGVGCACTCDESKQNWTSFSISGDKVYVDCENDNCWTPDQGGGLGAYEANDYCRLLDYAGTGSWILPTKDVLYEMCNVACDNTCFDENIEGFYWTTTDCYYDWETYCVYTWCTTACEDNEDSANPDYGRARCLLS